jgi:hypothetical protein
VICDWWIARRSSCQCPSRIGHDAVLQVRRHVDTRGDNVRARQGTNEEDGMEDSGEGVSWHWYFFAGGNVRSFWNRAHAGDNDFETVRSKCPDPGGNYGRIGAPIERKPQAMQRNSKSL